jgi:glycosyltransferase involved in cell wall biosynthesis
MPPKATLDGCRFLGQHCNYTSAFRYNKTSQRSAKLPVIFFVNPFLSVCIPVLNGSNFLLKAIESVLHQTSVDWELCISDNCSDDDTQRICERFVARDARVSYSRSTDRISAAANWDRAAKMARGKWFLMLGHDDLLEPKALATLESMAFHHPSNRIIIAAPVLIDAKGHLLEKQGGVLRQFQDVTTLSTSAFLDLLVGGMVCSPTGMFFGRSLLEQFGGFRHDLRGCCDYEFILRICAGSDVKVVPFPLTSYRIHDNQDVRSYVLDPEDDPELLLECVRQYRHISDIQIAQLVQNMVQNLCRSVRLRIEYSAVSSSDILAYRRSVETRIAKWHQDPKFGKFVPRQYPKSMVSWIVWQTHSTAFGVGLLRSFSRIAKTSKSTIHK